MSDIEELIIMQKIDNLHIGEKKRILKYNIYRYLNLLLSDLSYTFSIESMERLKRNLIMLIKQEKFILEYNVVFNITNDILYINVLEESDCPSIRVEKITNV